VVGVGLGVGLIYRHPCQRPESMNRVGAGTRSAEGKSDHEKPQIARSGQRPRYLLSGQSSVINRSLKFWGGFDPRRSCLSSTHIADHTSSPCSGPSTRPARRGWPATNAVPPHIQAEPIRPQRRASLFDNIPTPPRSGCNREAPICLRVTSALGTQARAWQAMRLLSVLLYALP